MSRLFIVIAVVSFIAMSWSVSYGMVNTYNLNGDYNNGLAADFGTGGLWYCEGDDGWRKLSGGNPEAMEWAADLNGDVDNGLAADFGTGGLWYYEYDDGWRRLSGGNPE